MIGGGGVLTKQPAQPDFLFLCLSHGRNHLNKVSSPRCVCGWVVPPLPQLTPPTSAQQEPSAAPALSGALWHHLVSFKASAQQSS